MLYTKYYINLLLFLFVKNADWKLCSFSSSKKKKKKKRNTCKNLWFYSENNLNVYVSTRSRNLHENMFLIKYLNVKSRLSFLTVCLIVHFNVLWNSSLKCSFMWMGFLIMSLIWCGWVGAISTILLLLTDCVGVGVSGWIQKGKGII